MFWSGNGKTKSYTNNKIIMYVLLKWATCCDKLAELLMACYYYYFTQEAQ